MNELQVLAERIKYTVRGEVSLDAFAEWYENWFSDLDVCIIKPDIFQVLEELYSDVGYFEPNTAIRAEHESYFGEERFIGILKNVLRKLER